ncbi:hypothetical protein BB560_005129 [Smittium megazygosporum]|uniref:DNA-directed RNA polymerases I and III subunit RPAC2 n=1 Tax=Smittium megazygosporum TaxID=133381 RepID=A0A2T9Z7I2_9FUNG|nr:hypothetical protein BB560_005129 [Smittium megazygosporum]
MDQDQMSVDSDREQNYEQEEDTMRVEKEHEGDEADQVNDTNTNTNTDTDNVANNADANVSDLNLEDSGVDQSNAEESIDSQLHKIKILPGASSDLKSCTFQIREEDHTLGNSLRYMVLRNPNVDFCGYSIPHPSEHLFNLRIQTDTNSNINAVNALNTALNDLINVSKHALETFQDELESKDYIIEY